MASKYPSKQFFCLGAGVPLKQKIRKCGYTCCACYRNPSRIVKAFGELVGDAGNAALTPQSKLQGHKENGVDDYTGAYEATYSEFTGTEILFGGTTLEREAGSTIHITCSLSLESGEAAVFLRSGADDPIILLSESGEYDGTIEVDGTSTYIGVWGDRADGTVSIEIE